MSFALDNMHGLSDRPCFGLSVRILPYDKAINRITIEVVLFKCCRTSIVLQISSATATNNPNFCKGIAVRALKLFGVFTELEELCLVHVFHKLLRCFTEPVNLLRLAHILKELFLVLVGLKLLDQLGDCMSSSFIFYGGTHVTVFVKAYE